MLVQEALAVQIKGIPFRLVVKRSIHAVIGISHFSIKTGSSWIETGLYWEFQTDGKIYANIKQEARIGSIKQFSKERDEI